jgi:hypothetical protein
MFVRSVALLCAVVLVGCATTSTPLGEATQGTVLAGAMTKPTPGAVPVTVRRDQGMMGAACSQRVAVNGVAVADLRSGQWVTFYVQPGRHILGARPNGLCGGGDAETDVNVQPGMPMAYRISSDQAGSIRLQPTAGAMLMPEKAPAVAVPIPPQAVPPSTAAGGPDRYSAEVFVRASGCQATPLISLVNRVPGVETYAASCTNGSSMVIRCEFGNCRALR